jgi:hypothetical protein
MNRLLYRVSELFEDVDPKTGERFSGDEVWLKDFTSEKKAMTYAKKKAMTVFEVQIRAEDQRSELMAHWYVKSSGEDVRINQMYNSNKF